jgi:hypothetical protein
MNRLNYPTLTHLHDRDGQPTTSASRRQISQTVWITPATTYPRPHRPGRPSTSPPEDRRKLGQWLG